MSFRPGHARGLAMLQEPAAPSKDSFGEDAEEWADVGEHFLQIRPLSGRSAEIARGLYGEVTHEVTIPYVDGVAAEMRWKLSDTRSLVIVYAINSDEGNRELVMQCLERVSGA